MAVERCLCARCVPTDLPVVCSRCGEEVRWGTRGAHTGYLHRDADHQAILGHTMTTTEVAEIDRQLDVVRHRSITKTRKVDGEKVVESLEEDYTVRELDLARYRKSKKFQAMEEAAEAVAALERGDLPADEDEDDHEEPLPPVEVPQHDVTADDFPPRSGIRQIANLVTKTPGWTLHRFTASRGPYTGSKGKMLSMSDMVVLQAVGPVGVDGSRPVGVASWRDGKFDSAYTGLARDGSWPIQSANATELKDWIKRER